MVDRTLDNSSGKIWQTSPGGTNPWGLAACALVTLALLLASLQATRWLTIVLAILGLLEVLLGVRATREERQTKDTVLLALGGTLSGVVLLLALVAPGMLNDLWALNRSVPPVDLNKMVRVPRMQPKAPGIPLSADDWVDPLTEAIRQEDLVVRLDEVRLGQLPGKEAQKYLLIHLRLGNSGQERRITFEGFTLDKHVPLLRDDSGQAYPFVEMRPRKLGSGLVFVASTALQTVLGPSSYADMQLVFEAPPPGVRTLKLELPAAAWGRKGDCKMRLSTFFKTSLPTARVK